MSYFITFMVVNHRITTKITLYLSVEQVRKLLFIHVFTALN